MDTILTFLCNGGDLPHGIEVVRSTFAACSFVSEAPGLSGAFLCTKCCAGPPAPRRAVYAIRGLANGRVALQRLRALGPGDEAEIRKLAAPEPGVPGGWTADPVAVQRLLRVIAPGTLVSWATDILSREWPPVRARLQEAIADAAAQGAREREAALREAIYLAATPWREAMRARRGPLLRELWAALWCAQPGRVKSVFFAMERIDVRSSDQVFHAATYYGAQGLEEHFVTLEPAGTPAEEGDYREENFVRRHAHATATDAYECMRQDPEAPAGNPDLRLWLLQHCGKPSRRSWCPYLFQRCPERIMMLEQHFVQIPVNDLIKEALLIELPPIDGQARHEHAPDDEYDPFGTEPEDARLNPDADAGPLRMH